MTSIFNVKTSPKDDSPTEELYAIEYIDPVCKYAWRLYHASLPPTLPRVGDHIKMHPDSPFPDGVWQVKDILWEAQLSWVKIIIEGVFDWPDIHV